LENGESLNADLVIVGVGVSPATEFLQGVELNEKDNSVNVDEYLQAHEQLALAKRLPEGDTRREVPSVVATAGHPCPSECTLPQ